MKSPDPRPAWLPAGARRRTRATASARATASVVAIGALTLTAAVSTTTAAAATSAAPAAPTASAASVSSIAALPAAATQTPFGDNVIVFDPSMPVSDIEKVVNDIHAEQVDDEMGTNRWSLFFKPGTYGTAEDPLQCRRCRA